MNRLFCVLEDKECTNCLECEMCDLNSDKVCDNCGECIEPENDYSIIEIDRIEDKIIEN